MEKPWYHIVHQAITHGWKSSYEWAGEEDPIEDFDANMTGEVLLQRVEYS